MIKLFKSSFGEFKSLKSLTVAAMLLALHTVLSMTVSIQVTESLKISISFIANCITAFLYGPVMAFVCGALGDIIQYIIRPLGPYFAGWTLNAALACLVYGIFFYGYAPKSAENVKSEDKKYLRTAGIALLCVGAVVWLFTDFASVSAVSETGETVQHGGSAAAVIRQYFSGAAELKNMFIMAVIAVVAFVILAALEFTRFNAAAIIISALSGCIMFLSAYTDKKTSDVYTGFIVTAGIFIVYAVVKAAIACSRKNLDAGFIFKALAAFTIVNIFVNSLLGTYWVSIMYGKGFMFYFIPRLIKNIIQIPINTVLAYIVLDFVKRFSFLRSTYKTEKAI